MTMRYQRSTVAKRVAMWLAIAAGVVLVVVLLSRSSSAPTAVVSTAHTIATPFWYVRDRVLQSVATAYEALATRRALVHENEQLAEGLRVLQRDHVANVALEQENERLRAMLGRATSTNDYVLASVLHGVQYAPYDTFVVDLGADGRVERGMLVLGEDGVAVGVVARALARSATVVAFSTPGFRWYGVVHTPLPVHIELEGAGGNTVRALVPRDVAIAEGQSVVLPNLPGSIVGTVAAIDMQPEDAYQTVYVRMALNPRHARFVLVDRAYVWRVEEQEALVRDLVTSLETQATSTDSEASANEVQ